MRQTTQSISEPIVDAELVQLIQYRASIEVTIRHSWVIGAHTWQNSSQQTSITRHKTAWIILARRWAFVITMSLMCDEDLTFFCISKSSAVTHLRWGALFQILRRRWRWENCENRPTFVKVVNEDRVAYSEDPLPAITWSCDIVAAIVSRTSIQANILLCAVAVQRCL